MKSKLNLPRRINWVCESTHSFCGKGISRQFQMQRSAGNLRHTSVLTDAITTEWRQRRRRAHRLLNMATIDTKWKNKGDNTHYLRSIWRWFLNKLPERSTFLSIYMINEAFSSYLPSLLPIYRGNRRYKSPFLQHKLQRCYWDRNQRNAS